MEPDARLRAAEADIAASRIQLRAALTAARAELEELARRPLLDEQERRDLQEAAQRGDLGREMQEVADDVRRGAADWDQVLRGGGGHRHALESFVQRAQDEHGERLARAFAEAPAPDDVEDPRRGP